MKKKREFAAPETKEILLVAGQTVMAGSEELNTYSDLDDLTNKDWN